MFGELLFILLESAQMIILPQYWVILTPPHWHRCCFYIFPKNYMNILYHFSPMGTKRKSCIINNVYIPLCMSLSLVTNWKWKKESEVAQLCPTLCNPMGCSPAGSSVHRIFQARVLQWVAISFSRGSFRRSDWTSVSCIVGRHLTIWATRKVSQVKVASPIQLLHHPE